ncbi:MAG: hypothetical protein JW767_00640, partial [Thermoleophilia bacterium]|nr:hypothetical protein [Thermoleophilia bacterium]
MNRFTRSALFPILIVIVVAMVITFFIQGDETGTAPIYRAVGTAPADVLERDLRRGQVTGVVVDESADRALVTAGSGEKYVVETDGGALLQRLEAEAPDLPVTSGAVPEASGAQSFTNDLINGRVAAVVMNTSDQKLEVTTTTKAENGEPERYEVGYPEASATAELLQFYGVELAPEHPGSPWWTSALTLILPFILIIGFWIFIMNQMQGGGSKVMSFGKSRARRVAPDSPKVTFKDVAGADEAVE